MANDDIVQKIDASLEKPEDEFEADLPALLEDIEGRTERIVRTYPERSGYLLGRMKTVDVASIIVSNPVTAATFQDLLWTGLYVLVESSPAVRKYIDETITVTLEADDCPMTGHLVVDGDVQLLYGGMGHLDDPMLEITGPAKTLVGLVLGSIHPIRGYIQQQYDMDGHVDKGTYLAPIMKSISEQISADSESALGRRSNGVSQ